MEIKINLVAKAYLCTLFCISQNIIKIFIYFFNCISTRRMERHGNHRADFTQINFDCAIIVSAILWLQFFISSNTAMNCIPLFNLIISFPDRRKTGCFSSHYINADTEISRKVGNARTDKFHNLIFYKSACKNFFNDCKSNILRTNTRNWATCQINCNNSRIVYIISFSQELLSKFSTALTDCHSS